MRTFYCEFCGSRCEESDEGRISGCEHYQITAMGKRLSDTEQQVFANALRRSVDIIDDPAEKAPCLAMLDELAAWSAKDAD